MIFTISLENGVFIFKILEKNKKHFLYSCIVIIMKLSKSLQKIRKMIIAITIYFITPITANDHLPLSPTLLSLLSLLLTYNHYHLSLLRVTNHNTIIHHKPFACIPTSLLGIIITIHIHFHHFQGHYSHLQSITLTIINVC